MKDIKVGDVIFGEDNLGIIAGPCVIENRDHSLEMSYAIKEVSDDVGIPIIFKSSFDKANRTSIKSFRGPGIQEGMRILSDVKTETGLKVLTDIHSPDQAGLVSDVVDIIQIPAFLSRQTDLLISAAKTGKPINIKKGQFLAPMDMVNVAKKVSDSGNNKILLTERGVSFGYNTLVSDMKSLHVMKEEIAFPVVFDATHSVQSSGGKGDRSGGDRKFVPTLAKAAVAVGVSSVFMETHDNPDVAPSDGPNMVKLEDLEKLVSKLIQIDNLVKEN